jgi:hypothetical protein
VAELRIQPVLDLLPENLLVYVPQVSAGLDKLLRPQIFVGPLVVKKLVHLLAAC